MVTPPVTAPLRRRRVRPLAVRAAQKPAEQVPLLTGSTAVDVLFAALMFVALVMTLHVVSLFFNLSSSLSEEDVY